jgi:hypothetical protein
MELRYHNILHEWSETACEFEIYDGLKFLSKLAQAVVPKMKEIEKYEGDVARKPHILRILTKEFSDYGDAFKEGCRLIHGGPAQLRENLMTVFNLQRRCLSLIEGRYQEYFRATVRGQQEEARRREEEARRREEEARRREEEARERDRQLFPNLEGEYRGTQPESRGTRRSEVSRQTRPEVPRRAQARNRIPLPTTLPQERAQRVPLDDDEEFRVQLARVELAEKHARINDCIRINISIEDGSSEEAFFPRASYGNFRAALLIPGTGYETYRQVTSFERPLSSVCNICLDSAGGLGCGRSSGGKDCEGLFCWGCFHRAFLRDSACPLCRLEYVPISRRRRQELTPANEHAPSAGSPPPLRQHTPE